MAFLMIQNPVKSIPSVELMRMLGASSSRGTGKIGQFGSGFPYSLALLARHNLLEGTKICLGKDVYTFELESHHVKDGNGRTSMQNEIRMRKQNGGSWDLNISTDFGALDWRRVELAVREFVSNAIDGVTDFGGNPANDVVIKTDIPDEGRMTRAADGFVRIYIPMNDAIADYIDNIQKYFRVLSPGYNPDRTVWLNTDGGPCRIYRKGVLVGTFGKASLFHYNINDIYVNESRIVDEYTAKEACAEAIAKCKTPTLISKFLLHKMNPAAHDCFENTLYVNRMDSDRLSYDDDEHREQCERSFKDAVKTAVGHKVICTSAIAAKIIESKGYEAISVDSSLAAILGQHEAKTADQILNRDELDGRIVSDATPEVQQMVDHVWKVIDMYNMTMNRPKPGVRCFTQSVTDGGMSGFVYLHRPKDNNIYIRSDIADGINTASMTTVLHEINHHITQADDSTYEFVDFAHRLAVALMMEGWSK
jgi:hypothetical protein